MSFDQMRHCAADAAMAVIQETTMGVERYFALAAKISRPNPRWRFAAPGKTEVFQQHRQRDRKAVIDRRIAHIRDRDTGSLFRPRDGDFGAELAQSWCRRDMLMGVRLRAAEYAHADLAGAFAADDERRAAVGHRTAVQQF